MSTNTQILIASRASEADWRDVVGALAKKHGAAIATRWKRYWTRRAQYAAIRLLQSFDERTLKDIGLTRDEIRFAVLDRSDRASLERGRSL